MVDTSYFDTTDIAIYFIEKSYEVESSSVTVPAGYRPSLAVPAQDTTFQADECFKITITTNMTMVGSGVDFGQKTISWLVKNKGLPRVKFIFDGLSILLILTTLPIVITWILKIRPGLG